MRRVLDFDKKGRDERQPKGEYLSPIMTLIHLSISTLFIPVDAAHRYRRHSTAFVKLGRSRCLPFSRLSQPCLEKKFWKEISTPGVVDSIARGSFLTATSHRHRQSTNINYCRLSPLHAERSLPPGGVLDSRRLASDLLVLVKHCRSAPRGVLECGISALVLRSK